VIQLTHHELCVEFGNKGIEAINRKGREPCEPTKSCTLEWCGEHTTENNIIRGGSAYLGDIQICVFIGLEVLSY